MAEVVHAGASMIARAPQTNLAGQTPKDTMNVLVQQTAALLSDEEAARRLDRRWEAAP